MRIGAPHYFAPEHPGHVVVGGIFGFARDFDPSIDPGHSLSYQRIVSHIYFPPCMALAAALMDSMILV